jgi:hypothetical protein
LAPATRWALHSLPTFGFGTYQALALVCFWSVHYPQARCHITFPTDRVENTRPLASVPVRREDGQPQPASLQLVSSLRKRVRGAVLKPGRWETPRLCSFVKHPLCSRFSSCTVPLPAEIRRVTTHCVFGTPCTAPHFPHLASGCELLRCQGMLGDQAFRHLKYAAVLLLLLLLPWGSRGTRPLVRDALPPAAIAGRAEPARFCRRRRAA